MGMCAAILVLPNRPTAAGFGARMVVLVLMPAWCGWLADISCAGPPESAPSQEKTTLLLKGADES